MISHPAITRTHDSPEDLAAILDPDDNARHAPRGCSTTIARDPCGRQIGQGRGRLAGIGLPSRWWSTTRQPQPLDVDSHQSRMLVAEVWKRSKCGSRMQSGGLNSLPVQDRAIRQRSTLASWAEQPEPMDESDSVSQSFRSSNSTHVRSASRPGTELVSNGTNVPWENSPLS